MIVKVSAGIQSNNVKTLTCGAVSSHDHDRSGIIPREPNSAICTVYNILSLQLTVILTNLHMVSRGSCHMLVRYGLSLYRTGASRSWPGRVWLVIGSQLENFMASPHSSPICDNQTLLSCLRHVLRRAHELQRGLVEGIHVACSF